MISKTGGRDEKDMRKGKADSNQNVFYTRMHV